MARTHGRRWRWRSGTAWSRAPPTRRLIDHDDQAITRWSATIITRWVDDAASRFMIEWKLSRSKYQPDLGYNTLRRDSPPVLPLYIYIYIYIYIPCGILFLHSIIKRHRTTATNDGWLRVSPTWPGRDERPVSKTTDELLSRRNDTSTGESVRRGLYTLRPVCMPAAPAGDI